jgi:hypothetical protein
MGIVEWYFIIMFGLNLLGLGLTLGNGPIEVGPGSYFVALLILGFMLIVVL